MQCFVLLNHDNTPLSPFRGSPCGGHNILVMGAAGLFQGRYNEVADAPMYATDIATDFRALLLELKRDDLLPEFNGEFAYRLQDFDHPNVPAPALTEQALDEQLRRVLGADVKEATAAAARIINGTRDIAGVAAAGAKVGTPTPQAQHRLQELLQDLKVVSARRLLLNPERHPVRLVGVDLAGTMSALQQAFGWVPEPLSAADTKRLKPVRVTLDLANASLIFDRCLVKTKVVPELSERRTTVSGRSGIFTPGLAAAIFSSFQRVTSPMNGSPMPSSWPSRMARRISLRTT
jgi:hypothetical protein